MSWYELIYDTSVTSFSGRRARGCGDRRATRESRGWEQVYCAKGYTVFHTFNLTLVHWSLLRARPIVNLIIYRYNER